MRSPIIAMLALALLCFTASADYTAYFSQNSSFAINADSTGFGGHYGNYSVSVHVFPLPSYVTVYGEGASQRALVLEIAWLSENGVLRTQCNSSAIYSLSYQDYYCAPSGGWRECSQATECAKTPMPAPQQALPQAYGQKSAAYETGVAAISAQGAESRSPQAGLSQPLSLEQLLPLLGAFVAVIVLSYLALQQRQVQLQIDPQEERLLSNWTRAGIMQELSLADRIPTDLSAKLGKSKATIVEHLDALLQAGFVEKLATPGRKFVFYRLTRKGKQVLLRRAG